MEPQLGKDELYISPNQGTVTYMDNVNRRRDWKQRRSTPLALS